MNKYSLFDAKLLQIICAINFLLVFMIQPFDTVGQNSTTGNWSPVYTGDMIPVAAANLPDGKILAWSAKSRLNFGGDNGRTFTSIFNPTNNRFTTTLISNTNHDMFCPGTANIGNGEIVVTGGSSSAKTSIYNPSTNTWRSGQDMKQARGYHSMCTLTDGRVFTVGGSWSGGRFNKNAEVWSERTGWVSLGNVTANNTVTQGAPDPQGIYRSDNHAWLWAIPDGRVFQAGPGTNMHIITTGGSGSVRNVGNRGTDNYAMNGTSVMYDQGKILTVGGAQTYSRSTNASNRSYTINISGNNATVNRSGNLNASRTYHSSVVLPNGEVVAVGGMCRSKTFSDECPRLRAEIWNPRTGQWRQGAPMKTPRTYHSVAILMKDGRVWVAGGGLCGNCNVNHPDAEIYTPPYLYNGNSLASRPTINNAPQSANYNSTINVTTNRRVQNFVLMRLASVTHTVNSEQRRIPLRASRTSGNNYAVSIPNNDWLPPGDYFLFAMDDGVPSVAKTIRIGSNANNGGNQSQLVANGTYYLEGVNTSQYMGAPSAEGNNVRMLSRGTSNSRKWAIEHQGNNVYTLKNLRNNQYLNVFGRNCANGTNVITWPNRTQPNSQWIISKNGNDFFLRPTHCTSQALDKNRGSNGNVRTWTFSTGNTNQRFKLIPVSNTSTPTPTSNAVILFNNCNYSGTKISLEVGDYPNMPSINFANNAASSIRVEEGYEVILYDGTNFTGGSITLSRDFSCFVQNGFNDKTSSLRVRVASGGTAPSDNGRVRVNGTFTIKNRGNGQNVIAPSWNNFSARMFSSATIFPDHRWTFNHIGNDIHTIRNVGTGRFLRVDNAGCANGVNIGTGTASTGTHRRWYVERNGNTYYLIPTHCTTRALDKNRANNGNVHLWNLNRSNANQQFELIRSSASRVASLDGGAIELLATPTKELQTQVSISIPKSLDEEVVEYTLQYIHEDQEEHAELSIATTDVLRENKFDWVHEQPQIGNNYYRVKITYQNGEVAYTPYQMVPMEAPIAPIHIAPNPVRDQLQIDLSNYRETSIRYLVTSITGQIMSEGEFALGHSDQETLSVADFQNGSYLIILRPEGHREQVQQFVVLK